MRLVGANRPTSILGLHELAGKSNYFLGRDQRKWRINVPNYAKVRYASVYSGVDLVYYGNQQHLEYDFALAPGVDPRVISVAFARGPDGRKRVPLRIDHRGDLLAHLEGGDVHFHKPLVYQTDSMAPRHKRFIDGGYVLKGEGRVGFEVGAYDGSKPLVIDPVLSYASYLGGSSADIGLGIALDRFGDAIITGSTRSIDFPTARPLQGFHNAVCGTLPCQDVYVAKFNPTGTKLLYSTFIGGSNDDVGYQVALDSLGDIFVAGYTLSTDFPVTSGAFQKTFGGGSSTGDGFVFELASRGTALVYSTYLGGSSDDQAFSLALDSSGNAYVAGHTASTDFPITLGSFQTACGLNQSGTCSDGFVAKLNNKGSALAYSTYLSGSNGLGESVYGIAVDTSGNAYVAGITGSPNFPTTAGAYDTVCGTDGQCNGTFDGFVTKLNPNGNGLVYSTFLGGNSYDYASGIAVDNAGAVYVSGSTTSADFPITPGAAQNTFGGMSAGCVPFGGTCGDVTVTKLTPSGSSLAYSTYLGGSLDESPGISMAIDGAGNAYVTGQTDSTDFPLTAAFQSLYGGGAGDAFITKVNSSGTAFSYSSYIGGNSQDYGYRTAVDVSGNAYVTGGTISTNFPVKAGAFQTKCGTDGNCNGGLMDAWVGKVVVSADLSLTMNAPSSVASGSTLTYTIVVKNNGPDPASSISTADTLPVGTTFNSVSVTSGACTAPSPGSTGTVTCMLATLPKGAKLTITLVVNVTTSSGNTISNTANVTSSTFDPRRSNNSASTTTTVM